MKRGEREVKLVCGVSRHSGATVTARVACIVYWKSWQCRPSHRWLAWVVLNAKKSRWLSRPTQLPTHTQWWSNRRTHRPQS